MSGGEKGKTRRKEIRETPEKPDRVARKLLKSPGGKNFPAPIAADVSAALPFPFLLLLLLPASRDEGGGYH